MDQIQTELAQIQEKKKQETSKVLSNTNSIFYNLIRARSRLFKQIPNFWHNVFLNFSDIAPILSPHDLELLLGVNEFYVIDSPGNIYTIKMILKENRFLNNNCLVKKVARDTGKFYSSEGTLIYWKPEMKETYNPGPNTLIGWFESAQEIDFIAKQIIEKLWTCPLIYFVGGSFSADVIEIKKDHPDDPDEILFDDDDGQSVLSVELTEERGIELVELKGMKTANLFECDDVQSKESELVDDSDSSF